MDVALLYFDGCPGWRLAQERLREALHRAGHPDQRITLIAVTAEEEARAHGFVGSPTIRINGRDPFSAPGQAVGMSCRVYATPDGLAAAPTVDQLSAAIADAV